MSGEGDKEKRGAWIPKPGVSADKSLEKLADKLGSPLELAPPKRRGK